MRATTRRRAVSATAVAAVLGVALFAAPGAGASITAKAAKAKTNKLTITATDYDYTLPPKVPAGWTTIVMKNKGGEDHQAQFAKLDSGVTFDQLARAAATSDPAAVVALTTPVGGPNAVPPGGTATVVSNLTPGQYAVICFIFAADGTEHDAKGMLVPLTVGKARGRTAPPNAKSTFTLRDFSFGVPAGFSGRGAVAVTNEGAQPHELALFALDPGKTLDDAKAFLLTPPGATPPPAPGKSAGGLVGIMPGETGYMQLDLKPGTYVAICFFPDPTKGGLPHAVEGMISEFTIS